MADRPLWMIAKDIRQDWKNVNFAAKTYLQAMGALSALSVMYGCDDGHGIGTYVLANASGWRGDVARRIKAELKQMLKH